MGALTSFGVATGLFSVMVGWLLTYGPAAQYDHAAAEASYMVDDYSSPPIWPVVMGVGQIQAGLNSVSKSFTPPPTQVMDMAIGFATSQLLFTVAKLKIADVLVERPKTADEIAREIGTDQERTRRVLNACIAKGIFDIAPNEPTRSFYVNSKLSAVLRTDHPHSMREMILHQMGDAYDSWSFLHEAIKSKDEVVFATRSRIAEEQNAKGLDTDLSSFYGANPEREAIFQGAMTAMDSMAAQAMVNDCEPIQQAKRVVDMGCAQGDFLLRMLSTYPELTGVGFDLPRVISTVEGNLSKLLPEASQKVAAERASFQQGSFFNVDELPAFEEDDVITMRYVFHEWSEADVVKILSNLRKAVGDKQVTLLVGESAIGDDPSAEVMPIRPIMDVNMMVFSNGSDRSPSQWKGIFKQAGWKLTKGYATRSSLGWTEATPV